jgi:hypothetical protein
MQIPTDHTLELEQLHEDAQVAVMVWTSLLQPFIGSVPCPRGSSFSGRVINRSLALIQSESPFREVLDAADVWALLTAYDEDLANWQDVYEALRSTLAP